MNKSNLISRKLIIAITITGITITALGIGQGSFANETNQVDYVAVQDATNQDRVQVVDKTEAIIKGKQERVAPFVGALAAACAREPRTCIRVTGGVITGVTIAVTGTIENIVGFFAGNGR